MSQLTTNSAVDFVQCLPYHVLNAIFRRFRLSDLIRYTRVSKKWQAFLLTWPGLWYDLSDSACNIGRHLNKYQGYFDGKHVRVVHILGRPTVEQEEALDFLIQHSCCYIESARISCNPQTNPRLLKLFKTTGRNLKSLHLYAGGSECLLGTVLQYCTGLTDLRYCHSAAKFQSISPRVLQNLPATQIHDLNLHATLSVPLLKHTLSLFPKLRRVDLNATIAGDNCGSILELLHQSCPRLEHIQFGGEHMIPAFSLPPKPASGLRVLILSYLHGISDAQLIPLLAKNGDTLEALHIQSCYSLGSKTLAALATAGCPRLRYMCIRQSYYFHHPEDQELSTHFSPVDLCSLLRKAPSLEEVSFSSIRGVNDSVLDALAVLPVLKDLELGHCNQVTSDGLCRFVQRSHADPASDMLKSLHLLGMDGVTDQVLYTVAQYMDRILESLDIGNSTNVTEAGVRTLVDRFAATGNLKWFGFNHCAKVHPVAYMYVYQKLAHVTTVYGANVTNAYNIVLSR